jgi:glyoxylase-like metal-dependent hydrolase (beta-lactamase superfamily II)
MSRFRLIHAAVLSCAVAAVVPIAMAAQQGELAIAPNVFASCQYRFYAIFPGAPMARDIAYTNGGRTVPARQFYVEQGEKRYSVTIADFTGVGPAIDEATVENAAAAFRQRGEVKLQFPDDYSPGIPGRQLNVFDANGRQHRASIYMADYRLIVAETLAEPSDSAAILFEQSVGLLDSTGRELNAAGARQRYACDVQPVAVESPGDLVQQAVAAQGGTDALRRLNSLSVKGDARFWEPGQSLVAGGEPRPLGTANFEITWDLAKGMAKTTWDRDQQYPPPAVKLNYTETVLPTLGFVTTGASSQPMSGIRVATHLRELQRASPRLLLKAMDNPANVRGMLPQQLGDRELPAVSLMDGGTTFIILFDPATKLPAAIRTRDDDNMFGDSNYDVVLDNWVSVGGARVARSLSYRLNNVEVARLNYSTVTPTTAIPANAFAVPATVSAAAKPPATGNVPYQWVLRRLFLTRLTDSDSIIYPDGGGLKLVELAPNVQHVQGGTANNLIVAMKDFLVVFDAPYGELQSRWVIDAAKAKYPGKPIKYLVLTHHHMDHAGGTRTYVAEGASLIVPSESVEYFQKTLSGPHTLVPDALEGNPRPLNIYGVYEIMTLKDETAELRLYNLSGADSENDPRLKNAHSDGMLIGHVVDSKLMYVTDMISPRGVPIARTPETAAVGESLRQFEIEDDLTFVGGHGGTIKRSEITAALAEENAR